MCIFGFGDVFLALEASWTMFISENRRGLCIILLLCTLLRSPLPAVFWRVPVLHRDEAGIVMCKINVCSVQFLVHRSPMK